MHKPRVLMTYLGASLETAISAADNRPGLTFISDPGSLRISLKHPGTHDRDWQDGLNSYVG
jgi:hypothetical protein